MHKVRVCFEIDGIAEDEQGNLCPAGAQMVLGETEKEFSYEELTANINIPAFLASIGLSNIAKPEDVRIITPQEYDERYGDEE